ncbi:FHA domain-containing protein [Propionicimonas sp.]|uniref:FHA domain-containing protein n=1 Tax=Propionicimonas sp. TaxID=1955623 RepID=UPI0017CDE036|nr:FHA domain-containing protein [Propionicimonas sp.]MBU3976906.1 FHA domain-containing protein [Actinomycetota bacterium]MBA3019595.1 FHA domain-containing protein [Propionicimonas sp.]MBU3987001.1 FHA domain-containing protein [Actinomycetota bacterium]MBU4006913.1 FHA domain-containing protein [Actinomycetota bacterium]MBU4065613.1 FHA domain-containing protein [Actinomycetota bacterium]
MTGILRYVPGAAVAVVHGRTAVLLDLEPGDPLVARVSALVEAGAGVDDVLDALVTSGLKALADFGAFEVTDEGVRLVVRGAVMGSVGELTGLAAERTMWHDTWQPAASQAMLGLSQTPSAAWLPIGSGVVLAAAVSFGLAEDAEATPVEPAAVESRPPTPAPAPEVASQPATEPATEPATDELAQLFLTSQRPVPTPEPEPGPEPTEPEEAAAPVSDPSATMVAPLTIPTADLPVDVPPATPPGPTALITGMPWLSGEATGPSVEPVAPTTPAPDFAPPPPRQPPAQQPPAQQPPAQQPPAPPIAPISEPPAAPSVLVADRTVNRSALVGLPPVVMVVAARCADGHLSPAYAGSCRVCGAPIPQQQPTEIPRPVLGQLRLSTGGVVALDRPVILGRNPHIPSGYAAEQPNLVRLPDPEKDVSGQHLEVSLDYWNVVVRDLGSTNGTEVILPGEMPVALRTNDPVIIEPGTRVVLAGTISFTFEVLP